MTCNPYDIELHPKFEFDHTETFNGSLRRRKADIAIRKEAQELIRLDELNEQQKHQNAVYTTAQQMIKERIPLEYFTRLSFDNKAPNTTDGMHYKFVAQFAPDDGLVINVEFMFKNCTAEDIHTQTTKALAPDTILISAATLLRSKLPTPYDSLDKLQELERFSDRLSSSRGYLPLTALADIAIASHKHQKIRNDLHRRLQNDPLFVYAREYHKHLAKCQTVYNHNLELANSIQQRIADQLYDGEADNGQKYVNAYLLQLPQGDAYWLSSYTENDRQALIHGEFIDTLGKHGDIVPISIPSPKGVTITSPQPLHDQFYMLTRIIEEPNKPDYTPPIDVMYPPTGVTRIVENWIETLVTTLILPYPKPPSPPTWHELRESGYYREDDDKTIDYHIESLVSYLNNSRM